MNSILSIFETAVADYLLLASMTAAILVAVAWGLVKMRKVEGPANRHMIWLFALIAIVLLPGIWLHGPKLRLTVLPADSSSMETAPQHALTDFTAGPAVPMVETGAGAPVDLSAENAAPQAGASPSFRFPPVMTLLAFGWGIGFLLMLIRLTFGGVKLRHLLQTAVPVADAMGLNHGGRQRIDLLLSSKVDCPVCFGLLRPVIVMPAKMYDETSPEDLRMILRHELAHIERKDCWVNLFQRLVEAALFFHPLVWYASFQLTQQREQLCDRHVIAGGASPENYVELLSRIARQGFEKRTLQAVALFEGRLLSRVQSLMGLGGGLQIRASRRAMGALAAAAVLFLAVGIVRLEAQSSAAEPSDTSGDNSVAASFRPQVERLGSVGNRPVGDCSLSGRVVSAETGAPVENATVYLFYEGTNASMNIEVASDGGFFFGDIPSGEYSLSVSETEEYQGARYDPGNNAQGISFFSLVEGEARSGIVFELEPLSGYNISGRILGEDGLPAKDSGLMVMAVKKLQEPSIPGSARYETEAQATVAKDGSYHLEALSGDPVAVMVTVPYFTLGGEDQTFPIYYYPGTLSRDQAEPVDFSEGETQDNIDIQLVEKDGCVLKGVVVDEVSGAPVANAEVAVNHPDMLLPYMSTHTDEKGRFQIENVGAGTLVAHIDARTSGYVRTRRAFSLVAGETAQLNVDLKPAATVSGVFIDENGEPFDVSKSAYGYAETKDATVSGDAGGGLSVYMSVSSPEDEHRERRSDISFTSGQGDYSNEDMIFPSADSFLLEAVLSGETTLKFFPKEQDVEVKQIFYNGENILVLKEMPGGSGMVAMAAIETRPGESIENVAIVLGPVVDSPPL